jgi:cytochrome c oxidase subunit I+III
LWMRAPGMSLGRMPLYVWAMLITAVSILFAFTPLMVGSLMLELDRKIGTQFFNPAAGGSPLLWQHVFWIFGHPEVYIQFLPATGMMAMIIPVFVRHRIQGYTFVAMAMVATGFISFALWVHHMFAVGLPAVTLGIFSAASILIAIPTGVQIIAYVVTILSGRPVWATPFLFAVGFLIIFVLGGITGVMVGAVPFDWQAHDSYFVVAHMHYVLIGGVVFPIFAALYFWIPKITGTMLNERLGRWNFWLMFIGFNVAFFPQHIVGLMGMARRMYTYPRGFGWDIYNVISTVGAFVLAAGIGLFIVNIFYSYRQGAAAGVNPWGGNSLEWSTVSPPLNYGFSVLPLVRSRDPLWDQPDLTSGPEATQKLVQALGRWPLTWRAGLVTSALDAKPQELFRISGPSLWPTITAVGLVTIFASEIFSLRPISLLGIFVLLGGIVGWIWPEKAAAPDEAELAFEREHGIPVRRSGSQVVNRAAMWLFILLIAIALMTFLFSYFYVRLEQTSWPPDNLPLPGFLWVGLGAGSLLVSSLLMFWTLRRVRQGRPGWAGLAVGLPFQVAATALLVYELWQTPFDWRINAYASLFFAINAFVLLWLLGGLFMSLLTLLWLWRGVFQENRSVAVENTAVYWLAIFVVWLVVIAAIYVAPYFL